MLLSTLYSTYSNIPSSIYSTLTRGRSSSYSSTRGSALYTPTNYSDPSISPSNYNSSSSIYSRTSEISITKLLRVSLFKASLISIKFYFNYKTIVSNKLLKKVLVIPKEYLLYPNI